MKSREKSRGPGIYDIAIDSGVSIATVSRVLNASAFVRPEVVARVKASMERLGYVRLRSGRPEAAGAGRLVGLIVPDIENPFFASLIKGVQATAGLRDFDIVLADPRDEPALAREQLDRLVARGVRAVLVVAPQGYPVPDSGLAAEGPRGLYIPVVYLDRRPKAEGVHYVGAENYNGAYNAAVYLGSLGHRDVLYLGGPRALSTEAERYSGFQDGMAGAAGSRRPDSLSDFCDFSLEKAYDAVKKRLLAGLDFSAIFAADDYMAFGALSALRDCGLRVPEDVSLVGFDDLPISAMIGLTTVRQQPYEIGSSAMALAFDLMDGHRKGPQTVILSTSLIIRGSCAVRG